MSGDLRVRFAPGYRDVDLLVGGRVVTFGREESEYLLRQLLEIHRLAWFRGQSPLDAQPGELRPEFLGAEVAS